MKKVLLYIVSLIFAANLVCSAEEIKKHDWELGTEVYFFEYREPGVMRERGVFSGLAGSYTYNDGLVLKIAARGAYGQVDYKNSGTIDDINDFVFETRGLGGYDMRLSERFSLIPFFGIGYRYLNDDLSGKISSTGAYGYERESNYIYSPIGAELIAWLDNGWSLGFSAEYDIFWWGNQKSHLSDVNPAYSDLDNEQDQGYGVRGSLRIAKKGKTVDFLIEPFIRYWNIKKSDVSIVTINNAIWGFGWEPKNETIEAGVRLAIRF